MQFSRNKLRAQVPVLENGPRNHTKAPNITRASGAIWVAQLCIIFTERSADPCPQVQLAPSRTSQVCTCVAKWAEECCLKLQKSSKEWRLSWKQASPQEHVHQSVSHSAQAQIKILSFQKQSCLLVAHLYGLFALCATMHSFQVKNCVKLVAQETKNLAQQSTGMKHAETFVLKQGYKQLYQWIQSKQ